MKETEVYLNVREISEVHEKKVQLKDVAQLWCSDPAAVARLNALTIKTIRKDRDFRYVESVLDLLAPDSERRSLRPGHHRGAGELHH